MQNDNTRGSLGSKFESFGAAPSDGLWDAIADTLEGKDKRKFVMWWWLCGAAIVVAAVGIIWTNSFGDNGQDIEVAMNSTVENQSEDQNANSFEQTQSLNDTGSSQLDMLNYSSENVKNNGTDNEVANDLANTQTNNGLEHLNQSKTERDTARLMLEEQNLKDDDRLSDVVATEQLSNPIAWSYIKKMDQLPIQFTTSNHEKIRANTITPSGNLSNKWEVGVVLSSRTSLRVGDDIISESSYTDYDTSMTENGILESLNTNHNIKVRRPIGIKFHLGYRLTNRFRLTSGLSIDYSTFSYAWQSFDVGVAEASNVGLIPVKIANIGIPVGFEYDLFKRRRYAIGVGAMVLNELPFLETYRPSYDVNYVGPKTNQRNIISGYNLGVALQLNASTYLSDKLRLQVHSGFQYYVVQKSTSSLYLPRRDFWFGGGLGLIWELGR